MSRYRKYAKKKVNIAVTPETIVSAVVGGIACFAVNPIINKGIERLPEDYQEMASKSAAAVKTLAGGYVAYKGEVPLLGMKVPPVGRAFSLGFAVGSGAELGSQFFPEQVTLGSADFYDYDEVGNATTIELPISPSGSLAGGAEPIETIDNGEVAIMGPGDMYEDIISL